MIDRGAVEFLLIGGGVIGAALAWRLAQRGRRVVLVESDVIGHGSTLRSVGGMRSLHRHRLEAELSSESRAEFLQLERDEGVDLGRQGNGQVLLAASEARAEALRISLGHAADLGIAASELSMGRLRSLLPDLTVDGIRLAAYTPDEFWYSRPAAAAQAYARLAAGAGAEVHTGTPVTAFRPRASGIEVMAAATTWRAEQIVVTAGGWFRPLLADLATMVAAWPYPRHVFHVEASSPPRADTPVAVFQDDDLYLRASGTGWLSVVGLPERTTTQTRFDPARLPFVRERVERRLREPSTGVRHEWSGLRCVTPDRRAIVGPLPGADGVWVALGFSGHGFMHAPATSRHLSHRLVEGSWGHLDLTPLAAGRHPSGAEAPVLEPGHQ